MLDIPITCYDGFNKRFKCVKCGYYVSYTMGKTAFKRFRKHYDACKESELRKQQHNESNTTTHVLQ